MAVDRIRLAEGLAAIVADVPGQEGLPERLCHACLAALPVDGVGLSLMTNEHAGGRMLLGATDAAGSKIEELQFSLGEGPCVTAFSEARPVLVPDVTTDEVRLRWPAFAEQVAAAGVGSLFAFPLQVGAIGIGVLDCHRIRTGPLEEVTEALVVATAVTAALLDHQARVLSAAEVKPELIDLSWRDHAAVHQATGMVSSQLSVPTDTALARLRAHAFCEGRPLKDVAADVVARRLRFSEEDGG
ncbi:GAF and ANTAR domain-containing protein [Saccharopolyspora sp. WRP15-2]|uniref:GAF and ANTAR domain-containing protein n=1 Tax=Saccharopolyspora oryzae TaxID=2997343 RepID=A0ABT4US66_9PSEU|nr:GAF and ANTAR domain-containing protein [Saccharopolyspora oryzae]MDA3623912.1 GAF and ANTAR domain-containing protein [Saccharopolyspora oryzae]